MVALSDTEVRGAVLRNLESVFVKVAHLGKPALLSVSRITVSNIDIAIGSLQAAVGVVEFDENFIAADVIKVKSLDPTIIAFLNVELLAQTT